MKKLLINIIKIVLLLTLSSPSLFATVRQTGSQGNYFGNTTDAYKLTTIGVEAAEDVFKPAECPDSSPITGIRLGTIIVKDNDSLFGWFNKDETRLMGLFCGDEEFHEIPPEFSKTYDEKAAEEACNNNCPFPWCYNPCIDAMNLIPIPQDIKCPDGYTVTGWKGFFSTESKDSKERQILKALRLFCQKGESWGLNDSHEYPSNGNPVNVSANEQHYNHSATDYDPLWWKTISNDLKSLETRCPQGSAVTTIGLYDYSLWGSCTAFPQDKPFRQEIESLSNKSFDNVFGKENGTECLTECNRSDGSPGGILVGLRLRTGGLVDQIEAICSMPNALFSFYRTSQCGGSGGETHWVECPHGFFVKGLQTKSEGVIDSLRLDCAPLDFYRDVFGSIVVPDQNILTRKYGGDGGSQETTQDLCIDGRLPTGLKIWHGWHGFSDVVKKIQGVCSWPNITEESLPPSNPQPTPDTNPAPQPDPDPDPQPSTRCGDGILQNLNDEGVAEQCDGIVGVGAHQKCDDGCQLVDLTYCGDGTVQNPNGEGLEEACDDGAENGKEDQCNLTCSGPTPHCDGERDSYGVCKPKDEPRPPAPAPAPPQTREPTNPQKADPEPKPTPTSKSGGGSCFLNKALSAEEMPSTLILLILLPLIINLYKIKSMRRSGRTCL